MHYAANAGQTEISLLFLMNGASVDEPDARSKQGFLRDKTLASKLKYILIDEKLYHPFCRLNHRLKDTTSIKTTNKFQ